MLSDQPAILQTLLGTFFTWGVTAAGAALVFLFSKPQYKILDGSLGFAAGVMLAASYWSLLQPAIDIAVESGDYGSEGQFAFIPVSIGFLLGAAFVFLTDLCLPCCQSRSNVHKRYPVSIANHIPDTVSEPNSIKDVKWRKILLLIIAITVHNIPEGLAVGVGFGAIGQSKSASFENARNLALGIGIQNFPEGLAVSLPLHSAGMSKWRSFWFGQLSGLVEPIFGVFGCVAISLVKPILPYAMAFAAGAMIFVVVDDIIPESQTHSNGKLASWTAMIGFIVMMILDVGLQ